MFTEEREDNWLEQCNKEETGERRWRGGQCTDLTGPCRLRCGVRSDSEHRGKPLECLKQKTDSWHWKITLALVVGQER